MRKLKSIDLTSFAYTPQKQMNNKKKNYMQRVVCIQRVAKLARVSFSVYSRKRDKSLIDRTGWYIIIYNGVEVASECRNLKLPTPWGSGNIVLII